jgi:hypothetical protein
VKQGDRESREITGRETLNYLDYVGSLNIQLWATLRGIRKALPLIGNRQTEHSAERSRDTMHSCPVRTAEDFISAPDALVNSILIRAEVSTVEP